MANLTKKARPSLASQKAGHSQVGSDLHAGEALAIGDLVYIKGADGLVYKSNGTAANEAAHVDGIVLDKVAYAIGDAVTVLVDVEVDYSDVGAALQPVPGKRYFASATAGLISDAATTGGTLPCAVGVDTTRIRIWGARYA